MENKELQSREAWLNQAAAFLIDYMVEHGLPQVEVHVSCGWPSHGGLHTVVGECVAPEICTDKKPQIFINPRIADSIEVLGILLHELIHAAIGCEHGHRKKFSQAARKVGLVGPPTATRIGDALRGMLERYLDAVGIYPHPAITPEKWITLPTKSRSHSRLRLWHCDCKPPIKIRVARDIFAAKCLWCGAVFHQVCPDQR